MLNDTRKSHCNSISNDKLGSFLLTSPPTPIDLIPPQGICEIIGDVLIYARLDFSQFHRRVRFRLGAVKVLVAIGGVKAHLQHFLQKPTLFSKFLSIINQAILNNQSETEFYESCPFH